MAVMLILWAHLSSGGDITYPGLAGRLFFGVRTIGWAGVDLFFVLSGFLITGILLDTRGDSHYFRNFYMRRSLRIFPLYFGVLIGIFLIFPLFSGTFAQNPRNQIWLWLYCSNFYTALTGGYAGQPNPLGLSLGHFWSLAVEEHFYLAWPLIVYMCGQRSLLRLCVGLSVFAFVIRSTIAWSGGSPYFMTPCRIDAIAMGALVAVLMRSKIPPRVLLRGATVAIVVSVMALLVMFPSTRWNPTKFPMVSFGYSLIGIFFAASLARVVLGAQRGSWLSRAFCNPALRTLGKYSYGIYVFHGLLLLQLSRIVPMAWLYEKTGRYVISAVLHLCIASCVSVLIAWVSWHAYEKHFLKLKRYFESNQASRIIALPVTTAELPPCVAVVDAITEMAEK